jgi:peptidoglycan hydrolase CwlO-like protein
LTDKKFELWEALMTEMDSSVQDSLYDSIGTLNSELDVICDRYIDQIDTDCFDTKRSLRDAQFQITDLEQQKEILFKEISKLDKEISKAQKKADNADKKLHSLIEKRDFYYTGLSFRFDFNFLPLQI